MPTLHDTLAFVYAMHEGVDDKGGMPYIMHPIRVTQMLPSSCIEDDRHIGLMHDVVEDCKERLCERFCIDQLSVDWIDRVFLSLRNLGYSAYVERGLRLLTRDLWPYLTYMEYVQNIIDSGHLGAMWVKYKDNTHNSDLSRIAHLPRSEVEKWRDIANNRYARSMKKLEGALGL